MKNQMDLEEYELQMLRVLTTEKKPLTAGQIARRTRTRYTPNFINNTMIKLSKRGIIEVIVPGNFKPFKYYTK